MLRAGATSSDAQNYHWEEDNPCGDSDCRMAGTYHHGGHDYSPSNEPEVNEGGEEPGHGMLISELLGPEKPRIQRVFHDRRG